MSSEIYLFPRTKFVDENSVEAQLIHVESEQAEVWEAYKDGDMERTAEEALDLIHSAETLLGILAEKHGVDVAAVALYVEEKNQKRGYYTPLNPLAETIRTAGAQSEVEAASLPASLSLHQEEENSSNRPTGGQHGTR